MLQLFLRLCRATDRFTHHEGVLGVHGVLTKYANVYQNTVDCQNNCVALRSHGGRTHFIQPKFNMECMAPMQII
jgi:hypothetical protein